MGAKMKKLKKILYATCITSVISLCITSCTNSIANDFIAEETESISVQESTNDDTVARFIFKRTGQTGDGSNVGGNGSVLISGYASSSPNNSGSSKKGGR